MACLPKIYLRPDEFQLEGDRKDIDETDLEKLSNAEEGFGLIVGRITIRNLKVSFELARMRRFHVSAERLEAYLDAKDY